MGIEAWSTTASSNNSSPPNGWPEGQAASSVNDCARQMMASIRAWFEDAQWVNLNHTPTRIDNDTFTVPTDLTAIYHAGRRLKLTGGSTGYATIASSSYSAPDTTVNVTMDSGNLPNPLSAIYLSILSFTNSAIPSALLPSIATDRLLGRDTAGTGGVEQLSLSDGLEFTGAGGIRIADDGVTFAKMQNVATNTLVGRSTAGTGDPESITCTAAGRALIDDADASAQRTTLGLGTAATQSSGAFAAASHTHGGGDITSAVANATNATNATNAVTADKLSGSTGSAPHYSCRGAGKFYWNGSSVVTMLGLNCSISRLSTGLYRCTFSTAIGDGDYAITFGAQQVAGNAYIIAEIAQGTTPASGSFDLETFNSGGRIDPSSSAQICFAVFR